MSKYSIDGMSEGRTTHILKQMSKIALRLEKDPHDRGLLRQYYFRTLLLDPIPTEPPKHLRLIYRKITTSSTKEKLQILNDFYNELKGIMQNTPKYAHIPYYEFIKKLFSIAKFEVINHEGNKSGWRSIRDKYKAMLDYSIPQIHIEELPEYSNESTLENIDRYIKIAKEALAKSEIKVQNDYDTLETLRQEKRDRELIELQTEIDETIKKIRGSKFLIYQMEIQVEFEYSHTPNIIELWQRICEEQMNSISNAGDDIERIESDCDFCLGLFSVDNT